MKIKQITHPKLYFDYQEVDNGIKLFYYSNIVDDSGTRVAQSHIIDYDSFSDQDLNILNRKEYDKLLESLVSYEKLRHEQNICDCENDHRMIEGKNLEDLFNNLITFSDNIT